MSIDVDPAPSPVDTVMATFKRATTIVERSDLSWRAKYDLVFSEDISLCIHKLLPGFNPYDPDTSYEEDLTSYLSQLKEYLEN